MTDERVYLTYEQAEALLPAGDEVHVFMNPGPDVLVVADWGRDEVLQLLKHSKPQLSGPGATRMGHGLVVLRGNEPLFIATDAEALAQLNASLASA